MRYFVRKFATSSLLVSITLFFFLKDINAQTIGWAKGYGGNRKDSGKDIGVDAMNNSYISGFFTDSINFGNIPLMLVVDTMHEDIFLLKLDANGDPLWSHSMSNGITNHSDFPFNLSVNKDGWVAMTGECKNHFLTDDGTNIPGISSSDMFLALYDPNGNLQWAKVGGGFGKDMGTGVFIDDNGMIYCTGNAVADFTIFGDYDFNDSIYQQHVYIAQYDLAGSLQWQHVYSSQAAFQARHITGDNVNSIYLGGDFVTGVSFGMGALTSLGAEDGWIAKFNTNGSLQWTKSFGSSDENSYESAYTLATDLSGNFYLATVFKQDISFEGNSIVTGVNQNIAIAAFNSNGGFKWANVIKGGQSGQFRIFCLDLIAEDNIILTGCFSGIDTVGLINSLVITPFGDPIKTDAFLAAFNPTNGETVWATNIGSTDDDAGYGLAGNHTGVGYAVGKYKLSGTFGSFTLNTNGESDINVVKFDQTKAVSVTDPGSADFSGNITIAYPNPTTSELSIIIPANVNSLKLVNALGQVVLIKKINREGLEVLDLLPFSAGVYYLQLNGENQLYSAKVMKQE